MLCLFVQGGDGSSPEANPAETLLPGWEASFPYSSLVSPPVSLCPAQGQTTGLFLQNLEHVAELITAECFREACLRCCRVIQMGLRPGEEALQGAEAWVLSSAPSGARAYFT